MRLGDGGMRSRFRTLDGRIQLIDGVGQPLFVLLPLLLEHGPSLPQIFLQRAFSVHFHLQRAFQEHYFVVELSDFCLALGRLRGPQSLRLVRVCGNQRVIRTEGLLGRPELEGHGSPRDLSRGTRPFS